MIHEDGLPGHESSLTPKPEWQPRSPVSGRLEGRGAIVTSYVVGQVLHPNGGTVVNGKLGKYPNFSRHNFPPPNANR